MSIFTKIKSSLIYRMETLEQRIINRLINKKQRIKYNGIDMTFFAPNALIRYRIRTFAMKEPETLDWIDSFDNNAVVWDIGANIGLYSIYAAKKKNARVFAFEPSVFNLEFLAKNIHANQLQEKVVIFPLALSNITNFNLFKMNNPVWGGALSAFGVDFDQYGENFNTSFEYSILGLSADNAIGTFNILSPDYIKIDVDGIEHLILEGASHILKTVKSVLVEIDESFIEQSKQSEKYLLDAGLTLSEKHILLENSSQYNQLWIRD
jgi:FkbM family methyltransferase